MPRLLLLLALGCAAPQVLAQDTPAATATAPASETNALTHLRRARWAHKPHNLYGEPTLDVARRVVTENAAALAHLEAALAVPLDYGESGHDDRGIDGEPPLMGFLRHSGRLLALRARVRAADGDLDGAVASGVQAVALGLKVQEDGPLIPAMTGQAIEGIGAVALSKLVPQMTPAQLKSAAQRLLNIGRARTPFGQTLDDDNTYSVRLMEQELNKIFGRPTGPDAARQKAELDKLLVTYEVDDAVLYGPFALVRGMEVARDWDEGEDGPWPPANRFDSRVWAWQHKMAASMWPSKAYNLLSRTRAQARLSLLATALAARAYQIENKAAPASLQVLVPGYLPALPPDPFESEEPLRFKAGANTATIYSVGPDGIDNEGRDIKGRAIDFDSVGDILAPAEILKF